MESGRSFAGDMDSQSPWILEGVWVEVRMTCFLNIFDSSSRMSDLGHHDFAVNLKVNILLFAMPCKNIQLYVIF